MRRGKMLAIGAVALSLVGAGATALAAGTSSGGTIQVFVNNISSTKAKVLITGAIGDFGTSLTVDKDGKLDANGSYQKTTLKKGGFWLNTTALTKTINHGKPVINHSTCTFQFTGSAPAPLFNGTGAYAGIAGTLKITVTFAAITPRFASGARKGQCNFAQNAPALDSYQAIGATGKVSF